MSYEVGENESHQAEIVSRLSACGGLSWLSSADKQADFRSLLEGPDASTTSPSQLCWSGLRSNTADKPTAGIPGSRRRLNQSAWAELIDDDDPDFHRAELADLTSSPTAITSFGTPVLYGGTSRHHFAQYRP
ncbi:hypothetical protein ON010_g17877 [Phytophthora cinnamomi]|nr:hypothetical protein ON010_g17877 [Phytophthora cinnamomi]